MTSRLAAFAATGILGVLALFQLFLALGLPLGQFAWGGMHDGALPDGLRIAGAAAILIVALAAWLVLGTAGTTGPAGWRRGMMIGTLVFGAYFALNTLGNLLSHTLVEKLAMSPISAALSALFLYVGISAWRAPRA